MGSLVESIRRGGRALFLLIGAVIGGIAGVAAEALWVGREKPKQRDAYALLDEER